MNITPEENNKVASTAPKLPTFTLQDMLNAGVHFGHRCSARNTHFRSYLYGESKGIHLIDLRKSFFALKRALDVLYDYASKGKRILFVSTIEKFQDQLKDLATQSGQYYVSKWKGGTLTNWRTIVSSIKTLKKYNSILESIEKNKDTESSVYTKKEILTMRKTREKLLVNFGGIEDMSGMPDLVVALSSNHEKLTISETACVGIPVIGIVDTNADPTSITYPIPGNDDSLKAISFYSDLFLKAVQEGNKEWVKKGGVKQEEVESEFPHLLNSKKKSSNSKKDRAGSSRSNNKNSPEKLKRGGAKDNASSARQPKQVASNPSAPTDTKAKSTSAVKTKTDDLNSEKNTTKDSSSVEKK